MGSLGTSLLVVIECSSGFGFSGTGEDLTQNITMDKDGTITVAIGGSRAEVMVAGKKDRAPGAVKYEIKSSDLAV